MNKQRSKVTFCARAKLLNLLDGKFGILFSSTKPGFLSIDFLDDMPKSGWVLLETTPRVFVDNKVKRMLGDESCIDFDFSKQELVIRKA